MMPTLQEIYQEVVEQRGQDSPAARAIRQQLEAQKYQKGRSAERLFIAGGLGRQMQAIKKNKPA